MVYGMTAVTDPISAEDHRCFYACSLYFKTAINRRRVFTTILRVSSGSGHSMFCGKPRPYPNSQESNTLLWPVDLKFLLLSYLFDAKVLCRWISTHLSSPSSLPRDRGWSIYSTSLPCKVLSPKVASLDRHCDVWFMPSMGDSPARGVISQIPEWV